MNNSKENFDFKIHNLDKVVRANSHINRKFHR